MDGQGDCALADTPDETAIIAVMRVATVRTAIMRRMLSITSFPLSAPYSARVGSGLVGSSRLGMLAQEVMIAATFSVLR